MRRLFLRSCSLVATLAALNVSVQAAEEKLPWWRTAVFYEVFVRSFADSTSGPLANDGVGDLRGLTERLDYLNDGDAATTNDLGITGIWLMPIQESPSYHGYDITDYNAVDKEYGTREDFQVLTREAEKRGIRIIVDMVLNHTSHRHPWFEAARASADSPYRQWYVWDAARPTGFTEEWARNWHDSGNGWFYGQFGGHMPDLNFRTPEVTKSLHEMSRFWLADMGAAGFRLDAIKYLYETPPEEKNTPETHQWLKDYHAFCRSVKADSMLVGEVWDRTHAVAGYGPDELDLTFQFDLAGATLDAVQKGTRADLEGAQAEITAAFPSHQYATFLTNHDIKRVMTVLNGNMAQAKAAATIYLTSPGVPFVYYGEEIGMLGDKPDHDIRTPMQWSADPGAGFTKGKAWRSINPDAGTVNVAAQEKDAESLLRLYRKLIQMRYAHPALMSGDHAVVDAGNDNVHGFLRRAGGETILVLVNLSISPVEDYAVPTVAFPAGKKPAFSELLHGATTSAAPGEKGYRPIAKLAPLTGYVVKVGE